MQAGVLLIFLILSGSVFRVGQSGTSPIPDVRLREGLKTRVLHYAAVVLNRTCHKTWLVAGSSDRTWRQGSRVGTGLGYCELYVGFLLPSSRISPNVPAPTNANAQCHHQPYSHRTRLSRLRIRVRLKTQVAQELISTSPVSSAIPMIIHGDWRTIFYLWYG